MDRLELVVHHGKLNERIRIRRRVNKMLTIAEQIPQKGLAYGGRVNDGTVSLIHKIGTGNASDIHFGTLYGAANLDRSAGA
jgi:hypothetical protein